MSSFVSMLSWRRLKKSLFTSARWMLLQKSAIVPTSRKRCQTSDQPVNQGDGKQKRSNSSKLGSPVSDATLHRYHRNRPKMKRL
mmetsp:Transcript_13621/g.27061  ORF Transcript_13621/g.27061 Transcript_13621/m.27061 type:complete len:84 (-) Transcript_13621:27-278(-)